jgi:hypothetical protein
VCAVQPVNRDEAGELAIETSRWAIYMPADVGQFGGGDYLVTADGRRFDFDGDPWIDTRPRVGHVEVTARLVR